MTISWEFGEILLVLPGGFPARAVRFPVLLQPSDLPLPWHLLSPSTSNSSPLECPGPHSAAGLAHCLWHLRPHDFIVVTAKVDSAEPIPDQLLPVGQLQVPLSVTFLSPPRSPSKKSKTPSGCWHPIALPGQGMPGQLQSSTGTRTFFWRCGTTSGICAWDFTCNQLTPAFCAH